MAATTIDDATVDATPPEVMLMRQTRVICVCGAFARGEVLLLDKSPGVLEGNTCYLWGKGLSSASILLCRPLPSLSCSKLDTLPALPPVRVGV